MNYTPLAHLTNQEFLTHLANKADPTDEDMEAMTRLELVIDDNVDLLTRCQNAVAYSNLATERSQAAMVRSQAAMVRSQAAMVRSQALF